MIDLHTHTTASDGVLEPEVLVKKAKDINLSAIAITDHDQVKAIPAAMGLRKKYGVEIIPGLELSCYWSEKDRKEFHILGYFIDWQNKKLLEKLEFFQSEREKRARKCLKILEGLGYKNDWDYLQKIAKGSIGRVHLARAVLENKENEGKLTQVFGSIPNVHDFITLYMVPGRTAYVEKAGFDPKEAIDLIHGVGGVAVLAHPCFDIPVGDISTIKTLREWGIEGLEAVAPFRTIEATRITIEYFSKVAKENDLLITGGSDYHGIDGIGAGLGLLEWGMRIEDRILDNLKEFESRGGEPVPPTRWKDG